MLRKKYDCLHSRYFVISDCPVSCETKTHRHHLHSAGDTLVVMLGRSDIWQTVKVSERLDNGRWHHVIIEPSMGQLKVVIDAHSFLSDHQGTQPEPEMPSTMYIGGKPK